MDEAQRRMHLRFGLSLGVSLLAMYLLAFSQVDRLSHVQWSLSVFWISLSMASAMGIVMLALMGQMLKDRRVRTALLIAFGVLLVCALAASRTEAFVEDEAFLRSMIPHHSRAIHMCQEAELSDPEVEELCRQIVASQRDEIAQMERIMERRD